MDKNVPYEPMRAGSMDDSEGVLLGPLRRIRPVDEQAPWRPMNMSHGHNPLLQWKKYVCLCVVLVFLMHV